MITHARVQCAHPHCAIIPPHLLRRIALNGDAAQREAALATLATDAGVRLARATCQLLESGAHRVLLTGTAAAKQRTVYDAHGMDDFRRFWIAGQAIRARAAGCRCRRAEVGVRAG